MSNHFRYALLALAAMTIAGCSDDKKPEATSLCNENTCGENETCNDQTGLCEPNMGCVSDETCNGKYCHNGTCVECVRDDQCADAQKCRNNQCEYECSENSQCDGYCADHKCQACTSRSQCDDGDLCRNGKCLAPSETNIECESDDDCSDNKVCKLENNQCVRCVDEDDCTNNEICRSDNTCGPECTSNAQCDGLCIDTRCVACNTSEECGDDLICHLGACKSPGDLPEGTCNTKADCKYYNVGNICDHNQCVECVENNDCAENADAPVCSNNQCVQCNDDTNCAGDAPACVDHVCVECGDNTYCAANEGGNNVCDRETTTCVFCASNADCQDDLVCVDKSECKVECATDDDCDGDRRCSQNANMVNKRCGECFSNEECAESVTGAICDLTSYRCVECLDNTQCSADNKICQNNTCVFECDDTHACSNASTPYCLDNHCKQCQTNDDCTVDGEVCHTDKGAQDNTCHDTCFDIACPTNSTCVPTKVGADGFGVCENFLCNCKDSEICVESSIGNTLCTTSKTCDAKLDSDCDGTNDVDEAGEVLDQCPYNPNLQTLRDGQSCNLDGTNVFEIWHATDLNVLRETLATNPSVSKVRLMRNINLYDALTAPENDVKRRNFQAVNNIAINDATCAIRWTPIDLSGIDFDGQDHTITVQAPSLTDPSVGDLCATTFPIFGQVDDAQIHALNLYFNARGWSKASLAREVKASTIYDIDVTANVTLEPTAVFDEPGGEEEDVKYHYGIIASHAEDSEIHHIHYKGSINQSGTPATATIAGFGGIVYHASKTQLHDLTLEIARANSNVRNLSFVLGQPTNGTVVKDFKTKVDTLITNNVTAVGLFAANSTGTTIIGNETQDADTTNIEVKSITATTPDKASAIAFTGDVDKDTSLYNINLKLGDIETNAKLTVRFLSLGELSSPVKNFHVTTGKLTSTNELAYLPFALVDTTANDISLENVTLDLGDITLQTKAYFTPIEKLQSSVENFKLKVGNIQEALYVCGLAHNIENTTPIHIQDVDLEFSNIDLHTSATDNWGFYGLSYKYNDNNQLEDFNIIDNFKLKTGVITFSSGDNGIRGISGLAHKNINKTKVSNIDIQWGKIKQAIYVYGLTSGNISNSTLENIQIKFDDIDTPSNKATFYGLSTQLSSTLNTLKLEAGHLNPSDIYVLSKTISKDASITDVTLITKSTLLNSPANTGVTGIAENVEGSITNAQIYIDGDIRNYHFRPFKSFLNQGTLNGDFILKAGLKLDRDEEGNVKFDENGHAILAKDDSGNIIRYNIETTNNFYGLTDYVKSDITTNIDLQFGNIKCVKDFFGFSYNPQNRITGNIHIDTGNIQTGSLCGFYGADYTLGYPTIVGNVDLNFGNIEITKQPTQNDFKAASVNAFGLACDFSNFDGKLNINIGNIKNAGYVTGACHEIKSAHDIHVKLGDIQQTNFSSAVQEKTYIYGYLSGLANIISGPTRNISIEMGSIKTPFYVCGISNTSSSAYIENIQVKVGNIDMISSSFSSDSHGDVDGFIRGISSAAEIHNVDINLGDISLRNAYQTWLFGYDYNTSVKADGIRLHVGNITGAGSAGLTRTLKYNLNNVAFDAGLIKASTPYAISGTTGNATLSNAVIYANYDVSHKPTSIGGLINTINDSTTKLTLHSVMSAIRFVNGTNEVSDYPFLFGSINDKFLSDGGYIDMTSVYKPDNKVFDFKNLYWIKRNPNDVASDKFLYDSGNKKFYYTGLDRTAPFAVVDASFGTSTDPSQTLSGCESVSLPSCNSPWSDTTKKFEEGTKKILLPWLKDLDMNELPSDASSTTL